MNPRVWLGFISLVSFAFGADLAPVRFTGVLTLGKDTRVALVTAGSTETAWVRPGEAFGEYQVKGYDAVARKVTLERDGKTIEISQATGEGDPALGGTPATFEDAVAVIDAIHYDALLEKALETQRAMMAKTAKNAVARMGVTATPEELTAYQDKVVGLITKAMDLEQMKKDVTQIYSQTYSKEELKALAAFYNTPTGQSFANKQTQITQKLQELTMPRIAAVSAQLQAASQEFTAQMKSKLPVTPVPTAVPVVVTPTPTPTPTPTAGG